MTQEKLWWHDKDFELFWGACFECCDYDKLLAKIEAIAAEAERRGREKALEEALPFQFDVNARLKSICQECRNERLVDGKETTDGHEYTVRVPKSFFES